MINVIMTFYNIDKMKEVTPFRHQTIIQLYKPIIFKNVGIVLKMGRKCLYKKHI